MELSKDEVNSIMFELEQEQMKHARSHGNLPNFNETPWVPVGRVRASDAEIDAMVEEAEDELDDESTVKPKSSAKGRKGQKMNQARNLFKSIKHLSRKGIIKQFISELGLSQGTANTYYYLLKKEIKE